MLTAPGAPAVLSALAATKRDAGTLLVILNHPGDVLAGNMAFEMATQQGINVQKVLTHEDISAGKDAPMENRRGLVGRSLASDLFAGWTVDSASLPEFAPGLPPRTRRLRRMHRLAETDPQYAVEAVLVEIDLAIHVDQPARELDQVLELSHRPQLEGRKRYLEQRQAILRAHRVDLVVQAGDDPRPLGTELFLGKPQLPVAVLAPLVDLLTQTADVDVDDIRLRIEVVIPHLLQQHRPRHHLAGMAHQVLQQAEFTRL